MTRPCCAPVRRAGACHGPWPRLQTVERANRRYARQSPLAGLPSGARWNGSSVSPSAPGTPPAEMARTGRRRQRRESGAWRWHRRRRRRRGRPWCPACSCPRASAAGSGPDVRGRVSPDLAQLVRASMRVAERFASLPPRAAGLGPVRAKVVGRHRACADIVGCDAAALWGETRSGSSARLPRSPRQAVGWSVRTAKLPDRCGSRPASDFGSGRDP